MKDIADRVFRHENAVLIIVLGALIGGLGVITKGLTIAPGYIRTEINDYIFKGDPERLKAVESAHAMNRIGEPIEIATVALFLASDASSYMTGSTVVVDGGFLWQSSLRAYQK